MPGSRCSAGTSVSRASSAPIRTTVTVREPFASGEMGAALFLGAASLSAGIVNAAAMTF